MRNHFIGSILAVVAVLAFSPVILAQQSGAEGGKAIRRLPDGKPDLSGVWARPTNRPDLGDARKAFVAWEPPSLQPWALEIYTRNRGGQEDPDSDGLEEFDPQFNCFPSGTSRILTAHPFEFMQLPGRVLILSESDHWVRRIYIDGRGHPDGYPITWMGHSIGEWDGDTLVIDTIDINDNKRRSWIDSLGHPHSDALHIVERIRRVDHDTLQIETTYDDPKAYTKPGRDKKVFELMPPDYEIVEDVVCDEMLGFGKRTGQELFE